MTGEGVAPPPASLGNAHGQVCACGCVQNHQHCGEVFRRRQDEHSTAVSSRGS